ncbi:hypothetical protein [Ornithobacterium rhinotracheale]|uniref:hypothetical protein n=1 Tax=Ornithobacterium rhinotracheale TaxID=28251 RepID=UPI004036C7E5
MKKLNKLALLTAMICAGVETPYTKEDKTPQIKRNIIPKGLKPFQYGYTTIYALNQKNADKKAKKLGFL